ncbi:DUF938 domain-containing protein [Pseudohaliea sp.]|uniref:DUF938 domain-containing protein n=1 Tax=Pseudohaliea sp. TaxID=2740289 RepID=UPI0032EAF4A6
MAELPFSQACENNREPILAVLREAFGACTAVLEIGAGTGQHATAFAPAMPWLRWQPTEHPQALAVLEPRCRAFPAPNLEAPRALDVCERPWPVPVPDGVFTANTLHIMPWEATEALFEALAGAATGTLLAVYGPFNYSGRYTSQSNAQFDQWLAARSPHSAIRDFEAVDALAAAAGFALEADHAMPANNRLLLWRRG